MPPKEGQHVEAAFQPAAAVCKSLCKFLLFVIRVALKAVEGLLVLKTRRVTNGGRLGVADFGAGRVLRFLIFP